MRKTDTSTVGVEAKILVSTDELRGLLGCGRATAVRIGMEAGARIQVGKRVLWKRKRVQEYLE